jgi:hypothetical protein
MIPVVIVMKLCSMVAFRRVMVVVAMNVRCDSFCFAYLDVPAGRMNNSKKSIRRT